MQDLVTIVVPVYKVEKYLDDCIQSIINQTYKNLEILLIDDGSPDRCPEICDEWARKDARIRVFHKENTGAGLSRNVGIDNAHGKYICFFDSDDMVDLHAIEKAHDIAISQKADIVIWGISNIDAEGEKVRDIFPETSRSIFYGDEITAELLPDIIDSNRVNSTNYNIPYSLWSSFFSMEPIKAHNWHFVSEREYFSEDSYSLLKLYKHVNCVAILPEIMYHYRIRPSSLSYSRITTRYFDNCKQFYLNAIELSRFMEYPENIPCSITGLFLSFVIASMKQIANSSLNNREQRKFIQHIVSDETTQRALFLLTNTRYTSRAKNTLYAAMRKKRSLLVWIFIKLQNLRTSYLG